MKKIISIFLFCLVFIAVSACYFSTSGNSSRAADEESIKNSISNSNNVNVYSSQGEKVSSSRQYKQELPMVFIGYINIKKGNVIGSDANWVFDNEIADEKTNQPLYDNLELGTKLKVDLMNCAGQIVSANIIKEGNYSWKIEFSSKTVSDEAAKKLEKCGSIFNDGDIDDEVFAVAPQDDKRRNTNIDKVDTRKEPIEAMMRIAGLWHERHPDNLLEHGDISRPGGIT